MSTNIQKKNIISIHFYQIPTTFMFLHEWEHLYQGEAKEVEILSRRAQVSITQVTTIQDRQ